MSRSRNNGDRNIDKPIVYEIKLQGHLDKDWSSWLDEMTISYNDSCTILTGEMADQSELRGLLSKVWDMNQTLVSVNRIEKGVKAA
jgi:hypothetical protein